ncbi:MAG: response regulator transcription factor [Solirubrobacterales bacterium]
MANETILVVDDESEIRELIRLYLTREGFTVLEADHALAGLALADSHHPDLIVLDVLLPDMDGIETCQELRKKSSIPVLFLSCKGEDVDKVLGLTVGGDDYITKPFSPTELVARVKSHLRRSRLHSSVSAEKATLSFPGLVIDLNSGVVLVDNQPVILSGKEFKILVLLAQNPNQVFSLEQIYQQLWSTDSFSDLRTVMVHISNLRKKIEPDPSKPRYIHTMRGFGYKFSPEKK